MNNLYQWAQVVHLFCAIAFVGGVFFEMLVLGVIHDKKRVSRESRREVERALSYRATRVMPFVVLGVFVSGITMALNRYLAVLSQPFASAFSIQLTLKICVAASILVHFVIAVYKMRTHTLTAAWSKYIHIAVFCHMVVIVLLAKTMFFVSW